MTNFKSQVVLQNLKRWEKKNQEFLLWENKTKKLRFFKKNQNTQLLREKKKKRCEKIYNSDCDQFENSNSGKTQNLRLWKKNKLWRNNTKEMKLGEKVKHSSMEKKLKIWIRKKRKKM